jgi:hypothetical protein
VQHLTGWIHQCFAEKALMNSLLKLIRWGS